jgi:hypothetical protein
MIASWPSARATKNPNPLHSKLATMRTPPGSGFTNARINRPIALQR